MSNLNKLLVVGQRSTPKTTTVVVFVLDGTVMHISDAVEAAQAACAQRDLTYLYCKRADTIVVTPPSALLTAAGQLVVKLARAATIERLIAVSKRPPDGEMASELLPVTQARQFIDELHTIAKQLQEVK